VKRIALLLVLAVVCPCTQSWAQCPEDPNDNGICDTLYIEIWPGDQDVVYFPHYARFPIRVTNDIPDPEVDSIAGIVTPLLFTSSNASANVRIEVARNTTDLYPFPDLDNSIFRHLPDMATATERNFMMDYAEQMIGLEWDTRILDIGGGTHFWLSIVPTGTPDRRFPGGSRVLTATMTFTIEDDTTTICMDTCFWPPTGFLAFSRSDAVTYFPRHFLPVCQAVSVPCPMIPYFTDMVEDQSRDCSGLYVTDEFWAYDPVCGPITQAGCSFEGDGVENVSIVAWNLYWYEVWGHVEYDVTDPCASGGRVDYWVVNWHGGATMESFQIDLTNDPPELSLSDTWRALVGYTMGMQVSASDPNENPVTIELEGFWYQEDSLQSPATPPSWDGENPGLLTWAPIEADTGSWVCAFSASDGCGCGDAQQVVIHVHESFCGDCSGDELIDLADVVYLITYLYKQGPAPEPECRGDTNCDGLVDVGDVVLLVSYLFKFGSAPCCCCCP